LRKTRDLEDVGERILKPTKGQLNIATRVLAGSDMVYGWAVGEVRFLEVDPDSLLGKTIIERKTIEIAHKIINNRRKSRPS